MKLFASPQVPDPPNPQRGMFAVCNASKLKIAFGWGAIPKNRPLRGAAAGR